MPAITFLCRHGLGGPPGCPGIAPGGPLDFSGAPPVPLQRSHPGWWRLRRAPAGPGSASWRGWPGPSGWPPRSASASRPRRAISWARIPNFRTLPATVIAKPSTKRMYSGILQCAIRPRQNSRPPCSEAVAPSRSLIPTRTFSPRRSSGTPTTYNAGAPGTLAEELPDLAGADVLAALDEHLPGPAGDPEVAVFSQGGEVAGAEPAAGVHRPGRALRVLVVPLHH